MNYMLAAVATVLFTILFLVGYKVIVNPQVVYTPSVEKMSGKCPDKWEYIDGLCRPTYPTECLPFNPDSINFNTPASKCNLAQTCGTFWSGECQ
jgi:hypothetical protein